MTEDELAECHPGVILDEALIDELQGAIRKTYRDRLSPADLADPAFADECRLAREELLRILGLEDIA